MERGWVGRIDGEHVIHLAAQTLQAFFTGGGAREHAVYPLDAIRLLAPVLHPPTVRVFEDQASFEFANPAAIVGPDAEIRVLGEELVLVPRLAAVIGAEGALDGFTAFAEWRLPVAPPPKDRDFALGLGPIVITPDEFDPRPREVVVRVDGDDLLRTKLDAFDWEAARGHAAAGTTLRPGDLLAGPAAGAVTVEPGAAVELEIDGIGVLGHTVLRD